MVGDGSSDDGNHARYRDRVTSTTGQVAAERLDLMTPTLYAKITGDQSTGGQVKRRSTRDLIATAIAGTAAAGLSLWGLTDDDLGGRYTDLYWVMLIVGVLTVAYVPFARRIDRRAARAWGLRQLGLQLVDSGILANEEEALQLCRKAHITRSRAPFGWAIRSEIIRSKVLHTLLLDGNRSETINARLLRRGPEAPARA